jgi:FkbM family methyltransferase
VSARRDLGRAAYWTAAIWRHPANRGRRAAAVGRAVRWHLRSRRDPAVEARVVVDGTSRLVVKPGQFAAVWTLYDGVHEWDELQFVLGYLRPGDHFVDVGANVGVFSVLVGTRLPGVRITAIEPFPPVVADLERNLALNELDVTLVPDAVGAEPGQAAFEVLERDVLNRLSPDGLSPDGAGAAPGTTIPVAVRTLDDLVGDDPPALVKIDVEGAELTVLRGAQGLLREAKPVVLFEHCGHGASFGVTPSEIRAFFEGLGYTIHLLDPALTPWRSDELPPMNNVIATTDAGAVRARLAAPGGARAIAPVRVQVEYAAAGGG